MNRTSLNCSTALLALACLFAPSAEAQLPVRIEGVVRASTLFGGPLAGIPVGAPTVLEFDLDLDGGGIGLSHYWVNSGGGFGGGSFTLRKAMYMIPASSWSFDIGGVSGPSPVADMRFTLGENPGGFELLSIDSSPLLAIENWNFHMIFPAGFWETFDPALAPGVVNYNPVLSGPWSFGATYGLVIPQVGAQQEISIVPTTLTFGTIFPIRCAGDGGATLGCSNCPCSNEAPAGSPGGCMNSVQQSALLVGRGVPSALNDTLEFDMRGLIPGSVGLLLSSSSVTSSAGCPSGTGLTSAVFDGLRCLGSPVVRHGARVADLIGEIGSAAPGYGGVDGPLGGLIDQGGFAAGQTRNFQYVYRDDVNASCGRGINTSNVVSVLVMP